MRFWLAAFFALVAAQGFVAGAYAEGGLTGIYRGIVLSSDDPANQHRLRVRVPETGTDAWALACMPYGQSTSPPAGSTVWIMFENGDPSSPVWIGWLPGGSSAGIAGHDHTLPHRRLH